eukprot:TRINITY_DN46414_c0_g1_i1.p1 TRINITY_DN46414_c0_g1~~TRINITY_DN46414_c0_g1_i1.p1  ORF type:complete len:225 (-),score=27.08 TRINITY_DN46414_c0_g1_i1:260-934(-)
MTVSCGCSDSFHTSEVSGFPDYIFRCSYCIKLISEDAPIYMLLDSSFCSMPCRDKGRSKLFVNLRNAQLMDVERNSLMESSLTASSDTSLTSRSTQRDKNSPVVEPGKLVRFAHHAIDCVLRGVAAQPWGAQMLRAYSSGLVWGRELAQDSKALMLLDYLPQVDAYMSKSDMNWAAHSAISDATENLFKMKNLMSKADLFVSDGTSKSDLFEDDCYLPEVKGGM